jgi:hypothetical protein
MKLKHLNPIKIFSAFSIILFSCNQNNKSENKNRHKELNKNETSHISEKDSLLISFFEYGLDFLNVDDLKPIYQKYGPPKKTIKTLWCNGECADSILTTIVYPGIEFSFFERENSTIELERINVYNQKVFSQSTLILGKFLEKEILEKLKKNHNSKLMLKNKTTEMEIYKNKSNMGDTTIVMFNLNIDEFSIRLLLAKDTVREVLWLKNMN